MDPESLTQHIQRLEAKIVSIEEQHANSDFKAQQYLKEVEFKQSEIKKLEGDLTRLKQHLIESQQENEMAVVDLKSTLDDYEMRYKNVNQVYKQNEHLYRMISLKDEEIAEYQQQVSNLQLVIDQYHENQNSEIELRVSHWKKQVERLHQESEMYQSQIDDMEKLRVDYDTLLKDYESREHKMSELEKENKDLRKQVVTLRSVLEETFTQMPNQDSEMIPKGVVRQLIVSYLSGNKPKDVLMVMTNMLDFNEEEKQQIGVNQGWLRYIPILGKRLSGGTSQNGRSSLSELWVQFLLNQMENPDLNSFTDLEEKPKDPS